MGNRTTPDLCNPYGIDSEFIGKAEEELSRRLRQPVTLLLGNGVIAVKAEDALFAGESLVVMAADPALSRKRAVEWADVLERKLHRLASRAGDVEHLYAEIEESPSAQKTGAIVLEHIADYDDDFFEALSRVIAHDKACRRVSRARNFEALREYLRIVRRRARDGETAVMWRELARSAAVRPEGGRS